MKFNVISDSAHAWAMVPRTLLVRLEIASCISSFSYFNKRQDYVFLEEDVDLRMFAAAFKRKFKEKLEWQETSVSGYADVRKLPPFQSGKYLSKDQVTVYEKLKCILDVHGIPYHRRLAKPADVARILWFNRGILLQLTQERNTARLVTPSKEGIEKQIPMLFKSDPDSLLYWCAPGATAFDPIIPVKRVS